MARDWPVPDPRRTLHLVGDVHYGKTAQSRLDKFSADLTNPLVPKPVRRIFVGDLVESAANNAMYDAGAIAWANSLPDGVPWEVIPGNHDYYTSGASPNYTSRTAADWGAAFGYGPTANWVRDLGFCRLIAASADHLPPADPPQVLSADTLTWLDQQLTMAGSQPCLVLSHGPLLNTVGGTTGEQRSSQDFFRMWPDADIRAVLAAHKNAWAWISGHTHSRLNAPDLVKAEDVGGRVLAAINGSSLSYTVAFPGNWYDPICSVYVTVKDDRLEVRFRDHGSGAWLTPNGTRAEVVIPT